MEDLCFICQILQGNLLNFMMSMNFQQLKKKKFRGFSAHFSTTKKGKRTDMILYNFSKNAFIFKTSYINIKIRTYVLKYLSVKICIKQKQVNLLFAIQINRLVSKCDEVLLKDIFEQAKQTKIKKKYLCKQIKVKMIILKNMF